MVHAVLGAHVERHPQEGSLVIDRIDHALNGLVRDEVHEAAHRDDVATTGEFERHVHRPAGGEVGDQVAGPPRIEIDTDVGCEARRHPARDLCTSARGYLCRHPRGQQGTGALGDLQRQRDW